MKSALLALMLLLPAAPASAQSARVLAPAEPLRAGPGATVLATMAAGAVLRVGAPQGGWREATLEGWIAAASVRGAAASTGLVVIVPGGEDIRGTPGGAAVARATSGVFLERTGESGPWFHVRRTGWVRARAVRLDAPPPGAMPAESAAAAPAVAAAPRAGARAGEGGTAVLVRPGADTLATVRPFAPLEVLGRQGSWTRVRVEGWAWTPALAGAADSAGVLNDLTAAALIANPDTYRGRVVAWTVQFIALRTAEPIRTDFQAGEPFLLTRGPGKENGFVYIGVPSRLLPAAHRLQPLQRISVVARVRNGRSPLMGAPVLDLVDFH
jgi:hypothetical protein